MGWLILLLGVLLVGGLAVPRVVRIFGREAFASPDTGQVVLHPELIHKLELLYDRVGGRYRVTGAYRTAQHNRDVGGAKNSFHLRGMAADVAPTAGLSSSALYVAAQEVGFAGVIWEKSPPAVSRPGWGPHLHLDVGSRIYHAIT